MRKPFIILERVGDGYFLTETDRGEFLTNSIGLDDASVTVDEASNVTLTSPVDIHNADHLFPFQWSKVHIDDAVGVHVQGNMNVDSEYMVLPTTFDPKTLTGSASSLSLSDDDMSNEISLPFEFDFYGRTYQSLYICSNGFVTFLADQPARFVAGSIPQTYILLNDVDDPATTPLAAIFAYWTDFLPMTEGEHTGGGTIKYQTFGDPGSQIFVVEWKNVLMYDAPSIKITTQIWLHEETNIIEIHTLKASTDGLRGEDGDVPHFVTQGIQDHYGVRAAYLGGRNCAFFNLTRDSVVISPITGNDFTLKQNGDPVLSRYQSVCVHLGPEEIENLGSSITVPLVPAMHHTIVTPVYMSVESTPGSVYTFDSATELSFIWGTDVGTVRAISGSDEILSMLQTDTTELLLGAFSVANDLRSVDILPRWTNQDLNITVSSPITGGTIELYITLMYEIIRVHNLTVGEA